MNRNVLVDVTDQVDRGTASAAEVLAGAIWDNHRGLLIGEPTFGKVRWPLPHELGCNVIHLPQLCSITDAS